MFVTVHSSSAFYSWMKHAFSFSKDKPKLKLKIKFIFIPPSIMLLNLYTYKQKEMSVQHTVIPPEEKILLHIMKGCIL